ncbi:MAG: hypothetical protein AABP62_14300 [Planctomycetota bacterium]
MTIDGSTLWAVPSVHYRAPFAEHVNQLVRRRHPQAIAVELGPQAAAATANWLNELKNERYLPCMLGLVRPNRRLHPQVRETAQRLQQLTQSDLSDLPPELLKATLGYSSLSVLYLSPTDSIIEAVRCALESDVPLYGVDLEETASPRRRDILLQDPTSMQNFSLPEYVERNDAYAEMQRDDVVDARREFAMAARLKTILREHKQVLYVCGLAHWTRMCELLRAAEPQPAPVIEARSQPSMLYRRVVVHPIMAIHHLDTFPAFATDYEQARVHMRAVNEPRHRLNLAEIFQSLVKAAYEDHFGLADESDQLKRSLGDWEARGDFEQLLRNLCTLRHRSIPDLITAMQVAQSVMSEPFCRVFAEKLMTFNWVSPNQDRFQGLPILAPAPSAADQPQRAEFVDRDGNRSPAFFVSDLPDGDSIPISVPIPWEWDSEPPPPPGKRRDGGSSNWIPIDTLMTALSFRAVRVAREQSTHQRVEAFAGSLLGGVDMKATLRSATRGEDRLYVRTTPPRITAANAKSEDVEGFPFVWIFRLAPQKEVGYKLSTDNLTTFKEYVTPGDDLDFDRSRYMVSSVIAVTGDQQAPELSQSDYEVIHNERVGQLCFQPDCSVRKAAEWAVKTNLESNPVLSFANSHALHTFYKHKFQLDLGDSPWHVALVRMAIPFARRAVTIVTPDGYTFPPQVYEEAARRQVELRVVPLSYFPTESLRTISHIYWLPTLGRNKDDEYNLPIYPPHVLRHFREPVDVYHRLIPKEWR